MLLPNLNRLCSEELPGDYAPRILPVGWEGPQSVRYETPEGEEFGTSSRYRHINGLLVIFSVSHDDVSGDWLHLSVSYNGAPPTWRQVMEVKAIFFGAESEAIQLVPKESDHVDLAHCHHIWKRP